MAKKLEGYDDMIGMGGGQLEFYQFEKIKDGETMPISHLFLKVFINRPTQEEINLFSGDLDLRFARSKNVIFLSFAPMGTELIYDAPYAPILSLYSGKIGEKLYLGDACDMTVYVIDSSTMEIVHEHDTKMSKVFFNDFIVECSKMISKDEKPSVEYVQAEINAVFDAYDTKQLWKNAHYFGKTGCLDVKED